MRCFFLITEGVLSGIFDLLNILLLFLPSFSFPAELFSVFSQVGAWLSWVNYYIPLEAFWIGALAVFATWIPGALIRVFLDLL